MEKFLDLYALKHTETKPEPAAPTKSQHRSFHKWENFTGRTYYSSDIMRRPQNLKKNLPPVLTKQWFLLSSVKTSGRFFQIFVAFSEKMDFTLAGA